MVWCEVFITNMTVAASLVAGCAGLDSAPRQISAEGGSVVGGQASHREATFTLGVGLEGIT